MSKENLSSEHVEVDLSKVNLSREHVEVNLSSVYVEVDPSTAGWIIVSNGIDILKVAMKTKTRLS